MSVAHQPPLQPEPTPPQLKPTLKLEKDVGKKIASFLNKWILLPLLGALISALVIGRLIELVLGDSSYKVYIVGNISEPETKEIADAFQGAGELPKINRIPVEIKPVDDSGDPDIAERISLHLASLSDTLLVVGHLESTPTQKALPAYLQIADPPIPVILTTETNPNLLPPKSVEGGYYPVFRLSPTDTDQAEKAASFILSKHATAIWVVEDTSNPVYSRYLAREFVRQVHKNPSAKVLLWSTNYNIPPAYAISELGINWVFFAGEWQDALVLIRQLKTMPQTRQVNILLTDWCVDSRLLQEGGNDVDQVYLTHALTPTVYNKGRYTVFGKDASQIVRRLLLDGDQHFDQLAGADGRNGYWLRKVLGLRRVGDARWAIAHVMESAALHKQPFTLADGVQATFGGDSNRTDASFQVWQIRSNKFSNPE